MAGQPKTRAFYERIGELGGIDYVCERIIDGRTMNQIGAEFDVSRYLVYKLVHLNDDNVAAFRKARAIAADALVEDAQQLLDDADPNDNAGVQKARNQADFRKWRAGMENKAQFGSPEKAAVNVNLNVAELHLDALRRRGGPVAIEVSGQETPLPATPAALPAPSLEDMLS